MGPMKIDTPKTGTPDENNGEAAMPIQKGGAGMQGDEPDGESMDTQIAGTGNNEYGPIKTGAKPFKIDP